MTRARGRADETHAIPASPRTSRYPCRRGPARDSGSPEPRPAPSSPSTSSPQEYTTLARSDSLRAQSPCHGTVHTQERRNVGGVRRSASPVIGGGATSLCVHMLFRRAVPARQMAVLVPLTININLYYYSDFNEENLTCNN